MKDYITLKKPEGFSLEIIPEKIDSDRTAYNICLTAEGQKVPSELKLRWDAPAEESAAIWKMDYADCNYRGIRPDWHSRTANSSQLVQGIPAVMLVDEQDRNSYAVFCSDDVNPVIIRAGAHEETRKIAVTVSLMHDSHVPVSVYKTSIIVDRRKLKINELLQDAVHNYWRSEPLNTPIEAKMPVYSSWYSFHQDLRPEKLLEQCRLSYQLGCRCIILDDGWQTNDNNRGYAYCGDWRLCQEKIPSMKHLSGEIHSIGMKVMMWFSVPFVGIYSDAYEKFKDMLLDHDGKKQYYTLDFRFKEVRDYLIDLYCSAVRDWDIDGLKLDFIDTIKITEHSKQMPIELNDAVRMFFEELTERLKEIKEDILIEFRQFYITPKMHNYANMFRVADCPLDDSYNRINSIDLRMINTSSAIHSDMLIWDESASPEFAAKQMIACLFCVPQISVMIDKLTKGHYKMLKFYLDLCIRYMDVLQNGTLVPKGMVHGYTSAYSYTDNEAVHVMYTDRIVSLLCKDTEIVVNGTASDELFIDSGKKTNYIIYNCMGEEISQGSLSEGMNKINIPVSGVLILDKEF